MEDVAEEPTLMPFRVLNSVGVARLVNKTLSLYNHRLFTR